MERRKVSREELDEVLHKHHHWLWGWPEEGERADLRYTNLRGMDLSGVDLRYAFLSGIVLREANLSGANLSGADAPGAHLRNADLTNADLVRTNLTGGILAGARLDGAVLFDTDLYEADLTGVDLSVALFSGCVVRAFRATEADQRAHLKRLSDALQQPGETEVAMLVQTLSESLKSVEIPSDLTPYRAEFFKAGVRAAVSQLNAVLTSHRAQGPVRS